MIKLHHGARGYTATMGLCDVKVGPLTETSRVINYYSEAIVRQVSLGGQGRGLGAVMRNPVWVRTGEYICTGACTGVCTEYVTYMYIDRYVTFGCKLLYSVGSSLSCILHGRSMAQKGPSSSHHSAPSQPVAVVGPQPSNLVAEA